MGMFFFDIAGKYITGRVLDLSFRYIYRSQLVDIIIPSNAYRIVFTVTNGRCFNVFNKLQ
jgi:hypothetical protein